MKRKQKEENIYCVDCTQNLSHTIRLGDVKSKIILFKWINWYSFADGDRCRVCAKNYKERVHRKKKK